MREDIDFFPLPYDVGVDSMSGTGTSQASTDFFLQTQKHQKGFETDSTSSVSSLSSAGDEEGEEEEEEEGEEEPPAPGTQGNEIVWAPAARGFWGLCTINAGRKLVMSRDCIVRQA